MTRRLSRTTILLAAALAGAALAGCNRVVETIPLGETAFGYGPTCHTPLGAYYLPRTVLTLSLEAAATINVTAPLGVATTADRTQTFCLDYLAALNSEDIITVKRTAQGLLSSISTNVKDKTPEIVGSLIDVASNLAIAGGREQLVEGARVGDKVDLQFDPFDWDDLMMAKAALRRFGFCVYVEGNSFPIHGLDPIAARIAGERWCSTANPHRPANFTESFATLPVPPEAMQLGVLYRPKVAYRVVMLRKRDPYRPGPWAVYQTTRVEMPNRSPVLIVGIERALFTYRETTIRFNDGTLTDVSIKKGSELEGFVSIPLKLAKAIVEVPAQIIQIRLTDVQNEMAVINAQGQLINALALYRQATAPRDAPASIPGRSIGARSAEVFGRCRDAGGNFDECTAFARSGR